jgi:hypothetical protein
VLLKTPPDSLRVAVVVSVLVSTLGGYSLVSVVTVLLCVEQPNPVIKATIIQILNATLRMIDLLALDHLTSHHIPLNNSARLVPGANKPMMAI